MRPKFETHAHSEFHFCCRLFFFFSKSRSYSRGALQAWAGQFKPFGNTIYLQNASALCSAYLLFLSSPENGLMTLVINPGWNVVSPRHQSHCQLSTTFSCHARSVSTPPRPAGSTCFKGGTAWSEASFVNGCVTDVSFFLKRMSQY